MSSKHKKSGKNSSGREPSSLHHVKESGISSGSSSSSDLSSSVYSSTISSHLTGDEEQEKHHIKDLVTGEEDDEVKSLQHRRFSIPEAIPEQSDEHSSKAGTEPGVRKTRDLDKIKIQAKSEAGTSKIEGTVSQKNTSPSQPQNSTPDNSPGPNNDIISDSTYSLDSLSDRSDLDPE